MDLNALKKNGWIQIDGVDSELALMKMAQRIGDPVPSPSGELIKCITPRICDDAHPGTLSHRFGTGTLPFHTDTAFWAVPARYLVFRVLGDFRRRTHIVSFRSIVDEALTDLVSYSIWLAKTPRSAFYCSMRVQKIGFRYDGNCMQPVNDSAKAVKVAIETALNTCSSYPINWKAGRVVIVDNWRVLHARGDAPKDEGPRTLERIYVR